MFNLKVKTKKNPPLTFQGKVNGDTTFKDLKEALCDVTSIASNRQKILIGFPPRQVVGKDEENLKSLGFQNGEVIIVEELASNTKVEANPMNTYLNHTSNVFPRGTLIKKVVPSDNSCLFASIYFLINGGEVDNNRLYMMREIVGNAIGRQPHIYNEALLETSNSDYCRWILKSTSWGGAIELSVFSDYYQTEIVALDAKTGLMNRFGEDKLYVQRIFLMYDGIHYDPVYLETYDGNKLFIFPTSEEWLLDQANHLVLEAKKAGQYTDTNKFWLICNECGFNMQGEEAVIHHAKSTSHSNFSELKRNG